ncbi:hypothetical protein PIB30_021911 [Stylosanthes scabra]|uniref:Uncharacterized protein n=1 Tax=Stylosanthes scabra TaxID=79078 RepID=A0ABU6T8S4_9FABA|nr:hypothetical protein [Stylosanthes scabra]
MTTPSTLLQEKNSKLVGAHRARVPHHEPWQDVPLHRARVSLPVFGCLRWNRRRLDESNLEEEGDVAVIVLECSDRGGRLIRVGTSSNREEDIRASGMAAEIDFEWHGTI